jgi:protein-S-isoprenylcysteine O-methyltransferase Ste14
MRYATVFMTWATLLLAYLVAGACLIPREHQIAYKRSPKDGVSYLLNVLWWSIPLTWFLAPSVPDAPAMTAGAFLFGGGAALLIWARKVNPFFLPVIRAPRWIVEDGPYRVLRHPGYAGFALMAEGTFLTLGHWFGVFPLVAYIGLLVARVWKENRILYATRNLDGDRD